MNKALCILLSGVVLSGCAASTQSTNTLAVLNQQCAAGYRNACAALPAQRAQVAAEEQANTTALVVGLGALAAVGAVAAASSDDGDRHYRRHRRYRY